MSIQISDIQLPAQETATIISILESNKMPVRVPPGGDWDFNCWGFTAFYHEWKRRAYWMDGVEMEDHLKTRTRRIRKSQVRAGDIAVFRRYDIYEQKVKLTHTAIVLPEGNHVCHKPGARELCIETLEAAKSYGRVTYVRVKRKTQKNLTTAEVVVR